MKADDLADLTRTEWARLIDECIHDRQWREIFKARWLDGSMAKNSSPSRSIFSCLYGRHSG